MWTSYLPTKNSLVLVGLWLMKRNGLCSQSFPLAQLPPPYVFTKIQKALAKHWREQGICIFTYLDDGVGVEKSLKTARAASRRVREGTAASGFVAHPEQCCWEPTQVGELLGFILNLREGISLWTRAMQGSPWFSVQQVKEHFNRVKQIR